MTAQPKRNINHENNSSPTYSNAREIIAVHKEEGNIAFVKLNDGTILSKLDAIALAKVGGIKDVNVGRRGAYEMLRRNPGKDASKSLNNLPRF